MLYLLTHYLLTPLLTLKHAVTDTLKLFIPTQVFHVVHVDSATDTITVIHENQYWTSDTAAIMRLNHKQRESGFYYIRTWDALQRSPREYFLSAEHLREALGVRALTFWWAMHDYGIQVLLNGYMAFLNNHIDSQDFFAVFDNHENDLSSHVRKFHKSLEIKKNITAHALTLLLRHLGHLSDDAQVAKILDYELNERTIAHDDFLVPPVKRTSTS